MSVTIVHAEALAWLRTQPDCSFDAFLADPPYGLSPDGRSRTWDIGAMRAGWDEVVAVEREAEYLPALRARVARWSEVPRDMSPDDVRATVEPVDPRQTTLFAGGKR